MAMSNDRASREFQKFEETLDGETSVRVVLDSAAPPKWDEVDLYYTGSNITTVEYKLNSVIIRTLILSYSGPNLTKVVIS
jgi:hypothetical protein